MTHHENDATPHIMTRLVQWDFLELRVSGAKLGQIAVQEAAAHKAPVRELRLDFVPGEIAISGKLIKGIAVPFRLAIRKIIPRGPVIEVPFENVSAFGFLPLPRILLQLFGNLALGEGVELQPERMLLRLHLDRFLPSFLDAEVEEVRIVSDGLIVRMGPGGADRPPSG